MPNTKPPPSVAARSRASSSPLPRAVWFIFSKRRSITPTRLKALVTINPASPSWAMLSVSPIASCISFERWATGWLSLDITINMTGIIRVDTRASCQLMKISVPSAPTAITVCATASSSEFAVSFCSRDRSALTTDRKSPVCRSSR